MGRVEERIAPEIVVEARGEIGSDLADYARKRMAEVLVHVGPVPRVHARVVRHGDPARENPVTAHANVDLDGRPVVVHAAAAKPRAAVDLLVERMRHRLERILRDRRPHHPQTGVQAGPRLVEPEIVRHATSSPTPCSVDEAVVEMDDLGLDFHLFVETVTGQDAVVDHDGPTGVTAHAVRRRLRPGRAPHGRGHRERIFGAAARHGGGGGAAAHHGPAVPVLCGRRPRAGERALPPRRRRVRADRPRRQVASRPTAVPRSERLRRVRRRSVWTG